MAAIHLIIDKTSSLLQVFVASIAVCTDVRGRGGVIANEALSLVLDVAREKAIELELSEIVITGKIHTQNGASEALFARGGFEPVSVPTGLYQVWALNLVL